MRIVAQSPVIPDTYTPPVLSDIREKDAPKVNRGFLDPKQKYDFIPGKGTPIDGRGVKLYTSHLEQSGRPTTYRYPYRHYSVVNVFERDCSPIRKAVFRALNWICFGHLKKIERVQHLLNTGKWLESRSEPVMDLQSGQYADLGKILAVNPRDKGAIQFLQQVQDLTLNARLVRFTQNQDKSIEDAKKMIALCRLDQVDTTIDKYIIISLLFQNWDSFKADPDIKSFVAQNKKGFLAMDANTKKVVNQYINDWQRLPLDQKSPVEKTKEKLQKGAL